MTPFRRSCRREHPGGEARGDALTPGRLFSFVFVCFRLFSEGGGGEAAGGGEKAQILSSGQLGSGVTQV